MAKSQEKLKALQLRRKGMSVKAIAKQLGVSNGSVSVWTRDVVLTPKQREALKVQQIAAGHRGRMMGTEANKKKKKDRVERARKEAQRKVASLSKRELFMLGLGLYWGEGVKASNGVVAVVNSDPLVIQIMIRWFTECLGVDQTRLQPRVYISDLHRDREKAITTFWVKSLGLPREQFRKMIFLNKGKKIYENKNMYYGVLTLRVARAADLRLAILAQIAQVANVGIRPA